MTSTITGAWNLAVSGGGVVSLGGAGAGAWAGTTTVHSGTLNLGRTTMPAIPGELVIGGASTAAVRLAWMGQLVSASTVRVQEYGLLDLNSFGPFTPLGNLGLRGGWVDSGNGPLTLAGDLVAEASALSVRISGIADLGATGSSRSKTARRTTILLSSPLR